MVWGSAVSSSAVTAMHRQHTLVAAAVAVTGDVGGETAAVRMSAHISYLCAELVLTTSE